MRNFEGLQIIAIEIGENCNLSSEHMKCPANSRIIDKQYGLLTNDDIILIINEAYDNGFNGEIGFHYYNEPLIYKKQILEIITNCSYAKFLLWTNGLLLNNHVNQNDFLTLFNSIVISNYGEQEKYKFYTELQKVYPNIKRIINYSSLNNLDDRKFIYENANNNIYGCKRPFLIELPIDCYGNVHLCCRDWNNTCIIGNVKSQTLLSIIQSEIFYSYEKAIFSTFLDLEHCPNVCKQCDTPDRVFIEIKHDSDPLPRIQSEISFVVVTRAKNEKQLITLLESLANLKDELVVILDNNDISIFNKLLSYADKVVRIPEKGPFEAYSKDILRHCSKDWIFRIDDDETLNAECTREVLQDYISDRTVMSYWIPRKWYINDHEYIVNAPWFPDYQMRLYRNLPGAITLPTCIHEPTLIYGNSVKLRERERERERLIYLKHWDLFHNSRATREEKVKYYENLRPGHSCGNFYLYEEQDFVAIDESLDFDFGFSLWEGTRLWTDGEKAQIVVGKGKKLVSFKLVSRVLSMKSIKVFFNDKPIQTIDMAAVEDGDLVKISLPQGDARRNLLLLELDKPSRPIDWTEGKSQDERVLGIMTENWKVE